MIAGCSGSGEPTGQATPSGFLGNATRSVPGFTCGQTLTEGLQAYWPLDGNGVDQVGGINLTASGDAGFDGFAPLVGPAAAQTFETPAVPRAGWVSANGHGSSFNVTNEYTVSSWYRLDVMGSAGEKSAFRQLHMEPPGLNAILEQTWGWFSPDAPTTYNHRAVGNDGAQSQSNVSLVHGLAGLESRGPTRGQRRECDVLASKGRWRTSGH